MASIIIVIQKGNVQCLKFCRSCHSTCLLFWSCNADWLCTTWCQTHRSKSRMPSPWQKVCPCPRSEPFKSSIIEASFNSSKCWSLPGCFFHKVSCEFLDSIFTPWKVWLIRAGVFKASNCTLNLYFFVLWPRHSLKGRQPSLDFLSTRQKYIWLLRTIL